MLTTGSDNSLKVKIYCWISTFWNGEFLRCGYLIKQMDLLDCWDQELVTVYLPLSSGNFREFSTLLSQLWFFERIFCWFCVCRWYPGTQNLITSAPDRSLRLFSTIVDQQSCEFSQGKHIAKKAKKYSIRVEELKLNSIIDMDICMYQYFVALSCLVMKLFDSFIDWKRSDFVLNLNSVQLFEVLIFFWCVSCLTVFDSLTLKLVRLLIKGLWSQIP
jgi:hypothetical protein